MPTQTHVARLLQRLLDVLKKKQKQFLHVALQKKMFLVPSLQNRAEGGGGMFVVVFVLQEPAAFPSLLSQRRADTVDPPV